MKFAGFRLRLLAFALDWLLISAYILVVLAAGVLVLVGPLRGSSPAMLATPLAGNTIAFLTVVLPVVLYFTLTESSAAQSTCGKRRLGLRVIDKEGGRLSTGWAFVRSLIKFLPWQCAHMGLFLWPGWPSAPQDPSLAGLICIGAAWLGVIVYLACLAFGKTHRTPYDWLAGSLVVQTLGLTISAPRSDGTAQDNQVPGRRRQP